MNISLSLNLKSETMHIFLSHKILSEGCFGCFYSPCDCKTALERPLILDMFVSLLNVLCVYHNISFFLFLTFI